MMRKAAFWLLLLVSCAAWAPRSFAAGVSALEEKFDNLRWVAYSPTGYDPARGTYPTEASIRDDLELLRQYGFSGVVTYGAQGSLADIPRIAVSVGFQGVVMGIWDVSSDDEYYAAVTAAPFVDGYCVGNEGLHSRYTLEELNTAIARIKEATNKPATTSEQVFDYANDTTWAIGDWVFPNIHPFLAGKTKPALAARWINQHYQRLRKHYDGRPVFFKEVGYPTSGAPMAGEGNQKDFFLAVEKEPFRFAYFEAFDQPWKTNLPVESHWGMFTPSRSPKRFAAKYLR